MRNNLINLKWNNIDTSQICMIVSAN